MSEQLPTEVAEFLDMLDAHARDSLSPARRAELSEIQRRRQAGLLQWPGRGRQRAGRRSRARGRAPAVAFVLTVLRGYGFFLAAAGLITMAAWDIARPLGLVAAAAGLLYLEYRSESGEGGDRRTR